MFYFFLLPLIVIILMAIYILFAICIYFVYFICTYSRKSVTGSSDNICEIKKWYAIWKKNQTIYLKSCPKNIVTNSLINCHGKLESVFLRQFNNIDVNLLPILLLMDTLSDKEITDILNIYFDSNMSNYYPLTDYILKINDNTLYYGDFSYTIPASMSITHDNKYELLLLGMRYRSTLSGGQQWSIPSEISEEMYKVGVRNEAFASPINSKFKNKIGANYFSLFDEDSFFGSSGNFLTATDEKLLTYKGDWEVNPPFLHDLLTLAIKKVEFLAKNNKKIFFITHAVNTPVLSHMFNSIIIPNRKYVWNVTSPTGTDIFKLSKFDTVIYYNGTFKNLQILREKWIKFSKPHIQ